MGAIQKIADEFGKIFKMLNIHPIMTVVVGMLFKMYWVCSAFDNTLQ
jgi:hypothetical protein